MFVSRRTSFAVLAAVLVWACVRLLSRPRLRR